MCDRYSWIEKRNSKGKTTAVLFLTPHDIFDTDKGRRLLKSSGRFEDMWGHGALRRFYGLSDYRRGFERENTTFDDPESFPVELRRAIKKGLMWGFGISFEMERMLTPRARREWGAAKGDFERALGDVYTRMEGLGMYQDRVDMNRLLKYAQMRLLGTQVWARIWRDKKNRVKEWR